MQFERPRMDFSWNNTYISKLTVFSKVSSKPTTLIGMEWLMLELNINDSTNVFKSSDHLLANLEFI
jgi:hypothetical protein